MSKLFTYQDMVICRLRISLSMDTKEDDRGGWFVIKYRDWLKRLFNILAFQFDPVIILDIDNHVYDRQFEWVDDFIMHKTVSDFDRYEDLFVLAYDCLEDFLTKAAEGNLGYVLLDFLEYHSRRQGFDFDFSREKEQIRKLQTEITNHMDRSQRKFGFKTELLPTSEVGLNSSEDNPTEAGDQPRLTTKPASGGSDSTLPPNGGHQEGPMAGKKPSSPLPPISKPPAGRGIDKKGPLPSPPSKPEGSSEAEEDNTNSPPRPKGFVLPTESEDDFFLIREAEINLLPLDYGPIEFYIDGRTVTYPMDREDISCIYKNLRNLKSVLIDLEKKGEGEIWAKLVEIIEEE